MHQGYISEEGILFTRHYGIYKSAEIIVAMKNVLKGNSLPVSLRGYVLTSVRLLLRALMIPIAHTVLSLQEMLRVTGWNLVH